MGDAIRNLHFPFADFSEREPLLRPNNEDTMPYTGNDPTGYFFTPIDSPEQSGSDNENEDAKRADAAIRYPPMDTDKLVSAKFTLDTSSRYHCLTFGAKLLKVRVATLYGSRNRRKTKKFLDVQLLKVTSKPV